MTGTRGIRKRARFSTLFWPSLYSTRALLAVPCLLLLLGGFIALLLGLTRQTDRAISARADERARAIIALKLSGVAVWQWKKELACENQSADCLTSRLSFTQSTDSTALTRTLKAPNACNICHAHDLAHNQTFYVSFPGVTPARESYTFEWLVIAGLGTGGLAIAIYLAVLRRSRMKAGVCVAAIRWSDLEIPAIKNLVRRLAASHSEAYYAERDGERLRWATTPEKFHRWLAKNSGILNEYRASLRVVALHIDLARNPLLPIETLRGIYQFLAQTPEGMYLLQERLLENQEQKTINMRRLVFKNKSGALLKFIAWEFV